MFVCIATTNFCSQSHESKSAHINFLTQFIFVSRNQTGTEGLGSKHKQPFTWRECTIGKSSRIKRIEDIVNELVIAAVRFSCILKPFLSNNKKLQVASFSMFVLYVNRHNREINTIFYILPLSSSVMCISPRKSSVHFCIS